VIFRVQSSRWKRNFIVLRVDLWRFLALSLDCTAQTAFAMTFGEVVLKRLWRFLVATQQLSLHSAHNDIVLLGRFMS